MAIAASTVFEIHSTATAGNVNGGGFNPANANMLTDGAATLATGNSPVFTSASYTFVAGDVGHWLFIKSGTNWTAGWYQIASVSGGAATLSAAIGQGVQIVSNKYIAQTVAGIATTASPTAATWTVDYSQTDTAAFTATDLTGTTTSCTSATNPFGKNMVGNLINLNSGTGVTVGWYEIVSISGTTATLDRTAGTSYSAVTYHTGGAASLNGTTTGQTDIVFLGLGATSTTAGNIFFIKGGSSVVYTISGAFGQTGGTSAWHSRMEGFASIRGDRPTGATRPTLACGANHCGGGTFSDIISLSFTGTGAGIMQLGTSSMAINCSSINSSTTAARTAFDSAGIGVIYNACEAVSYRGIGIEDNGGQSTIFGCYIHDSDKGIDLGSNTSFTIVNNIIASCVTAAIAASGTPVQSTLIANNTLYGSENKQGSGISLQPSTFDVTFMNNIIYGFVTGVTYSTANFSNFDDYNNYFNNTADIGTASAWSKGVHDIAVNPSFTSVTQLTGTTATSSGSVLTVSGGGLGALVPGQDYLYIKSGTGVTAGIYGITAVSGTTITTDIALGTGSAITWQVTTGRNFLPTGAV